MLIETMKSQGVDSFPELAAATIQGSTKTTFYVLADVFWRSGHSAGETRGGVCVAGEVRGSSSGDQGLLLVFG